MLARAKSQKLWQSVREEGNWCLGSRRFRFGFGFGLVGVDLVWVVGLGLGLVLDWLVGLGLLWQSQVKGRRRRKKRKKQKRTIETICLLFWS